MHEKHTLRINSDKHRDKLISQLYEKYGKGRSFIEFIKDVMYEISLTALRTGEPELLSLMGEAPLEAPAKKKGKRPTARKRATVTTELTETTDEKKTKESKEQEKIPAKQTVPKETEDAQQETDDSDVPAESIAKAGFSFTN